MKQIVPCAQGWYAVFSNETDTAFRLQPVAVWALGEDGRVVGLVNGDRGLYDPEGDSRFVRYAEPGEYPEDSLGFRNERNRLYHEQS